MAGEYLSLPGEAGARARIAAIGDFPIVRWDDGGPMVGTWEDRAPVRGRSDEIEVLTRLLDDVGKSGAALVLRGDPGIGKSRLLSEAIARAEERKIKVLATRGVQSEARLAFGGLQQLLRPVRSQATGLPATYRAVLDAALGLGDDEPPERFRIALAVLELLSDAASERPLLLVAEDATEPDLLCHPNFLVGGGDPAAATRLTTLSLNNQEKQKTKQAKDYIEWIGQQVVDQTGNKSARSAASFVDDQTGQPEWLAISTGMFAKRSSFVPLQGATAEGDQLVIGGTRQWSEMLPRGTTTARPPHSRRRDDLANVTVARPPRTAG